MHIIQLIHYTHGSLCTLQCLLHHYASCVYSDLPVFIVKPSYKNQIYRFMHSYFVRENIRAYCFQCVFSIVYNECL